MQENGFSVRGLAESAEVSRGVVSDILAEKYVPSEKRLLALMEAMRVKTQMKKKMLWLREETISASKKKLIPKRIRKNVLEDGRLAKSLMLSASNSGFQVTEIESDNFHFTVKRGNEKVAVAVRLSVQSWEFLFLDACRVIMQTGARTALIVTSEKGNPHKEVFEFHNSRFITI